MDVFLSYASEDRDRASQVAQALEESGWSVWWDRKIVAGETFDQTIERQLESARCVVVLWSNASVASEWVKSEAAAAADRQVLVPALIDDVKIPLEFRRRQTANLIDWDGAASHEGFHALREGVAARLGTAAVTGPPRPPVTRPRIAALWRRWGVAAAALAVVAIALLIDRVRVDPAEEHPTPSGAGESSREIPQPQPDSSNRGSGATSSITPSRVVAAPAGSNSVDNPAPLALGVMHKVTLEQNEEYYFRLSEPASAIAIVQDVRGPKEAPRNLQTKLSLLDQDGAVVKEDVIWLNEIDVGYRKTASFSTKQPSRIGFKLVNTSAATDIWLAVSQEDRKQFFSFFGEVVPQQWSPGRDATGTLEQFENVYYRVRLPRGENRVILDFANPKPEQRNLQGYLAVLDAEGGHQKQVIWLNEIQISYRAAGVLMVKSDEPVILRLQNRSDTVKYSLRIPSAQ